MQQLIFPIALFVLIFYFLIFRPQKKKQKEHDTMISSIGMGDTVITAGGFFGRVTSVLDDSYIIELADGVKVRILKTSISIRRTGTDAAVKSDRPRRKKRKKIAPTSNEGERQAESDGADAPAEDVAAANVVEEAAESVGITPAENAALIDEPSAGTDGESQAASDERAE